MIYSQNRQHKVKGHKEHKGTGKKKNGLDLLFLLCAIVLLTASACTEKKPEPSNPTGMEPLQVTVSILPQKYFVERIGGTLTQVNVMVPPGRSPAVYEPVPMQMKQLSRAQVYFRIGHILFEKAWMENMESVNKKMLVIDTSKGVDLIHFGSTNTGETDEHHEDNGSGTHAHVGIDPHIWLSPPAVKIQAGHIMDTLVRLDPVHAEEYRANCASFINDIDALHEELRKSFQSMAGRKFMVFHPAWGYLARTYGLEQMAVETEGKTPSPASLKQVIDRARQEGIKVVFVQQQFDIHSAAAVAADIDGKVIQLDPLAYDWLTNMKKIAVTLKTELNR